MYRNKLVDTSSQPSNLGRLFCIKVSFLIITISMSKIDTSVHLFSVEAVLQSA